MLDNDLLFSDIYERSRDSELNSIFIDDITDYKINSTISLNNEYYYNSHLDNNVHVYKLLYISNSVNDVSNITSYKNNPEFIIDNVLSNTESENIKYIQTFLKQDILYKSWRYYDIFWKTKKQN